MPAPTPPTGTRTITRPWILPGSDSDGSGVLLLQAALAEPQRPRSLLKARALLDVSRVRDIVGVQLAASGLPRELQQHI